MTKINNNQPISTRNNMTSFKIGNDDFAVRSLLEKNKKPAVSGTVVSVTASKPVQKSPENQSLKSLHLDRRDHDINSSQRRETDRRTTAIAVLLDTRSQHERRVKIGRSSDADIKKSIATLRGIDEMS